MPILRTYTLDHPLVLSLASTRCSAQSDIRLVFHVVKSPSLHSTSSIHRLRPAIRRLALHEGHQRYISPGSSPGSPRPGSMESEGSLASNEGHGEGHEELADGREDGAGERGNIEDGGSSERGNVEDGGPSE